MPAHALTYLEGDSPVHALDARVKIVALLAYSIGIFVVSSGWALAAFALVAIAIAALAQLPWASTVRMLAPVLFLGVCSIVFNLVGNPSAQGFLAGLHFCVRMLALALTSFVVCLSSSSADLLDAFAWFIRPLRKLHVPTDDVALTLALSIRFIPVIETEFASIRAAQLSRGAGFAATGDNGHDTGRGRQPLMRTLQIWGIAFAALFIGLFRHADALASAMDARCYGASPQRTRLQKDTQPKR